MRAYLSKPAQRVEAALHGLNANSQQLVERFLYFASMCKHIGPPLPLTKILRLDPNIRKPFASPQQAEYNSLADRSIRSDSYGKRRVLRPWQTEEVAFRSRVVYFDEQHWRRTR